MSAFQSRDEETRDDWQTPLEVLAGLGEFDLDPCANEQEPTRCAKRGLTVHDDGLASWWNDGERVWCNPPYGAVAQLFILKMARHGNGVALIPPRVGADWFHRDVLATADAILFVRKRIAFIDAATKKPGQRNNADSCLIAWGEENALALGRCGIDGKVWRLK